ncbi:MAG: hypothetical protein R3C56_28920 [Pirellulaceae bacterium]
MHYCVHCGDPIASRVHFVMGYSTLAAGPPQLEPLLASNTAWAFACA